MARQRLPRDPGPGRRAGVEAIDEAAIEGLDQSDPKAVLVRWAELVAAKDPSACLLMTPRASTARSARPGLESCAELVGSGLLV